jgi:translation elongation factor EF-Tu-like GTPase
VVLVAQSGAGGRNGDGVGFLWRRKKEEEIEEGRVLMPSEMRHVP